MHNCLLCIESNQTRSTHLSTELSQVQLHHDHTTGSQCTEAAAACEVLPPPTAAANVVGNVTGFRGLRDEVNDLTEDEIQHMEVAVDDDAITTFNNCTETV